MLVEIRSIHTVKMHQFCLHEEKILLLCFEWDMSLGWQCHSSCLFFLCCSKCGFHSWLSWNFLVDDRLDVLAECFLKSFKRLFLADIWLELAISTFRSRGQCDHQYFYLYQKCCLFVDALTHHKDLKGTQASMDSLETQRL